MLAFTFPGQGSQRPGMGRPWVDHDSWELVGEASEVAGRDVAALLLDADAEELRDTRNAQLTTFVSSLMVLDAVERLAIRDKKSPAEVLRLLGTLFPETEAKQRRAWVIRFFRLWSRNQWKRERYAPSFHLDDENVDPKTWCRFPILSGGFGRELGELA